MTPNRERNEDVAESSYLLEQNVKRTENSNKYVSIPRSASKWWKAAVMASCLLLQFMGHGVGFGLAVMYAELIRVFGAPRAQAALIQSLFMGITTGGGIIYSGVIRRYGPGPCTVVGALVVSVGLFVTSYATNVTTIVVMTGIIASSGMSICYLAPYITISWIFHEDPGLPLVFLTMGSSLGQCVVPYIYEVLISEYQWFGAFMVLSALVLNCAPCGVIIYLSREYFVTGTGVNGSSKSNKAMTCDTSLLRDIIILMLLLNFFFVAFTGNLEAWFLVDIMTSRGYERETGSLLVSLVGFANLLGRICGGLLRLKCKIPTVFHWIYICPVLAVSHALLLSFCLFFADEHNYNVAPTQLAVDPFPGIAQVVPNQHVAVSPGLTPDGITQVVPTDYVLVVSPDQPLSEVIQVAPTQQLVEFSPNQAHEDIIKERYCEYEKILIMRSDRGTFLINSLFHDFVPLCAACLLYGISFGITVAQAPAIMFEASGLERYPQGMALVNMMYGTGNFLGGFIGGYVKDMVGEYDPAFYFAVGASLYISISTSVVAYLLRRRRRHKEVELTQPVFNNTVVRYKRIEDEKDHQTV